MQYCMVISRKARIHVGNTFGTALHLGYKMGLTLEKIMVLGTDRICTQEASCPSYGHRSSQGYKSFYARAENYAAKYAATEKGSH